MTPSVPQIALRYCRALYETCVAAGKTAELARDMELLEQIFAGLPEARTFCTTPHQNKEREHEFLKTVFLPHTGPHTGALLELAWSNRRMGILPLLPAAYKKILGDAAGTVEVVLECPTAVPQDLSALVARHMEERIGAPVKIVAQTNPALLGGFRILWQNKIIDQSARGRLTSFRTVLKSV